MLYRCKKLSRLSDKTLNSTLINVLMTQPKDFIAFNGATYGCVVDVQQDLLYKAPVVVPGSDGVFRAFEYTDIKSKSNASIVSFFNDLSHPEVLPGYEQLPGLQPLPGYAQLPGFQFLTSGLGYEKKQFNDGSEVSNPTTSPSAPTPKTGSDDQPVSVAPGWEDEKGSQTATNKLSNGESGYTISLGTSLSSGRLWGTAVTLVIVLAVVTILLS